MEWQEMLMTSIDSPDPSSSPVTSRPIEKEKEKQVVSKDLFSFVTISFFLYIIGSTICVISFIHSIKCIIKIIHKSVPIKKGNEIIYIHKENLSPFSWGNCIVMSEADYLHYPEEILTHERVHIRKKHTLDLIFIECILLLHWFNPAVWLLKRELQELHEYEADAGVLKKGIHATNYQLLLVKKAVGGRYTLTNSFNHSKIKNRITMMLKEKSSKWAQTKLLLLFPLGCIAFQLVSRPAYKATENQQSMQQDPTSFRTTTMIEVKNQQSPEKSYIVTIMVNAQGDILTFWNDSSRTGEAKRCSVQELPGVLKSFFAQMQERGNKIVGINLKLEINNQTSLENIKQIRDVIKQAWKQQNNLYLNSEEEKFRYFYEKEVPECYPVLLKIKTPTATKEFECSNQKEIEAINLTKADIVTIYADKNCKMGFISQLRYLLKDKCPTINIQYGLL
ncbi:M56 family metallopeptidase [Parabacteroides pacaensis]|uniref:M56 family metallopeptidase n=1 Tax=Parabacteroides pacaensis TaxID=2086575 RepID=UPI00131C1A74|nr:M56 family metallopeptidase [Parabacteroides pacaensis]